MRRGGGGGGGGGGRHARALARALSRRAAVAHPPACLPAARSLSFFGKDTKLIYRHYATLYFVVAVDGAESELGMLDLIQVFVEVLDKCFENVCELDLIFHPDKVNYILDEIIMGGMVLDTNIADVLEASAARGAGRVAAVRDTARGRRRARPRLPALLSRLAPCATAPACAFARAADARPQAITDMDKLEKTTKGAGIRA